VLLFGLLMHLNIYQTKMTRSQVHKKRVRKNTIIGVRRTRKTEELDHEKLVTVILGPLSERNVEYIFGIIHSESRCFTLIVVPLRLLSDY
jgi:hypothetical protein